MKKIIAGMAALALVAGTAIAKEEGDDVVVEPGQAVVQVNGLVCSFCAHGVEKTLKQLDVVDRDRFGGDGVFVDIDNHRVTLALLPEKPIPFAELRERIKKAGYDPVRIHLRLEGTLERNGEGWRLAGRSPRQSFVLAGETNGWSAGATVSLRTHLDAAALEGLEDGAPVPVFVDAVL